MVVTLFFGSSLRYTHNNSCAFFVCVLDAVIREESGVWKEEEGWRGCGRLWRRRRIRKNNNNRVQGWWWWRMSFFGGAALCMFCVDFFFSGGIHGCFLERPRFVKSVRLFLPLFPLFLCLSLHSFFSSFCRSLSIQFFWEGTFESGQGQAFLSAPRRFFPVVWEYLPKPVFFYL